MIAEYMRMQALGLLKTIFGAVAGGLGSGLSAGGLPGSTLEGGFANPALDAYIGAKGGVAPGGWQPFPVAAFANGGMVTGPTLGLVGEGRYNEAIIPLPDGKSVPVQLSGGAGGNAAPISTSIVVNVKNGQAESQMSGNQGNQLARELEGAVRQVILKESRPGGLISSSR
jgi:phage-related minor tail protein